MTLTNDPISDVLKAHLGEYPEQQKQDAKSELIAAAQMCAEQLTEESYKDLRAAAAKYQREIGVRV